MTRVGAVPDPQTTGERTPTPAGSQSSSSDTARPRWLMRSFSVVGELGHRATRRVVVGQERRVVAEAAVAAGLGRQPAGAVAEEQLLDASFPGRRRPARTRSAARCPRGPRAAAWRGSPRRWPPARRSAPSARPGGRQAPPPRSPSRRRSPRGRSRSPPCGPWAARCRRTSRRPRGAARRRRAAAAPRFRPGRAGDRTPAACAGCGSRGSVTGERSWPAGVSRRPAAATVSACSARSSSMPPAARASRSSRWARDSGVRSAVAWTSTSPPSPVITTLASTSAVESSE